MDSGEKAVFWKAHFSDWKQSGLTQQAYCKQHDLKFSTFGYWRKRLATPAVAGKLIPVMSNRHVETMIVISVRGLRLEVPVGSLEQVLPVVQRNLLGAR
ncbi:IS66 family insertion sequence element accessory protein TnpA [Sedimenticola selenatireducens]|uniref:IS66 family insertion sequence element accessory protein TnpA n=1 Tax=Sedimenticola selenatireducens TaxID=191960 RepID=UPI002AAAE4F0|nr:IS66 family insertion sequence element accessory protein TnpB [Sedimenticola selenatireducens]